MDVFKDYDSEIIYHLGKENVVVDALIRKLAGSSDWASCMRISVDSPLLELIREAQVEGVWEENWKIDRIRDEIAIFVPDSRGLLTCCGRVWVPMFGGVRQIVLEEAHRSHFSIHLGTTKMHRDLRLRYWWLCMKWEIAWYVERFLTCRMVKAKHQRPHGKLQPLDLPMWK
ncbi:hypothetical protein Lser_V15G23980 [Lactuca serriola]